MWVCENCLKHPKGECKPLYVLKCIWCKEILYIQWGQEIECPNCKVWTPWDKKERAVSEIKVICGWDNS